MKLEFLKIWHKSFLMHIEYVIEGLEGADFCPQNIADSAACDLGKWIASHRSKLSELSEFSELIKVHDDFHHLADEIVKQYLAGMLDKKSEQISTLRFAVNETIAAINKLEVKISDPSIGVTDFRKFTPKETITPLWSEAFNLNIPLIDEQHCGLVQLIESSLKHGDSEISSELASEFLESFQKLFTLHCQTEELLMQRLSLAKSDFDQHKKEHSKFLEWVVGMQFNAMTGTGRISDVIPQFMEILIDHILNDAKDMARYAASINQERDSTPRS